MAIVDTQSYCEIICDGIHVHPAMVRMLRQFAGPQRVILVTDSIAWSGLADGNYGHGADEVLVRGEAVRMAGTGTLAGSTLTMAEAVRRYLEFTGAGLVELAAIASVNPARLFGEDGRIGRIRVGQCADFVVLTSQLTCTGAMIAGQWVRPFDEAPGPV